jgi:hypothetical protein
MKSDTDAQRVENRMRKSALMIAAVIIAFGCGFATGSVKRQVPLSFHDVIVNDPREMVRLITPDDKRIRRLAAELKTPENAYTFVRDRIINDASLPALPAGDMLEAGKASCMGKAILLCSLYRALGLPASDVRVIAGEVDVPGSIIDHAWLEMEYKGKNIQQDASNLLGTFGFGQFEESTYVQVFIRDEEYVFNDRQFAIVSQLNRMKGSGHPPMQ